ncbi:861_t:CDS:2, partial [Funneliformis geosporum]
NTSFHTLGVGHSRFPGFFYFPYNYDKTSLLRNSRTVNSSLGTLGVPGRL